MIEMNRKLCGNRFNFHRQHYAESRLQVDQARRQGEARGDPAPLP